MKRSVSEQFGTKSENHGESKRKKLQVRDQR